MMKKISYKKLFFLGALVGLLVLSGCGLNQRSAATDDPVPVQPIQEQQPTPDQSGGEQTGGEQTGGETNSGDGSQSTDGSSENSGDQGQAQEGSGETTDPNQAGDGADQGAGGTDSSGETPREDDQTTEAPAEEPTVAPVDPTPVPPTAVPQTNPPNNSKHVVSAGQTLFSIAQLYNLTVAELAAANGIVNPNLLAIGEELVIPAPGTVVLPETVTVHTVQYGDTLFNIAQRYGLTVEALALHNNIANINRIDIGDQIKIPSN